MQRRFVIEHEDVVVQAARADATDPTEENEDVKLDEENDPNSQSSMDPSAPKKRKHTDEPTPTATVGKVPKGQDFWSRVDKWLAALFKANGSESMKTPKWQK